jgi:hypothetical protein
MAEGLMLKDRLAPLLRLPASLLDLVTFIWTENGFRESVPALTFPHEPPGDSAEGPPRVN